MLTLSGLCSDFSFFLDMFMLTVAAAAASDVRNSQSRQQKKATATGSRVLLLIFSFRLRREDTSILAEIKVWLKGKRQRATELASSSADQTFRVEGLNPEFTVSFHGLVCHADWAVHGDQAKAWATLALSRGATNCFRRFRD